jgi:6-pyruvoyl-tetrahydropterin synthase
LFLVKRLSHLYWWNIEVESKEKSGTKFIINFYILKKDHEKDITNRRQ